MDYYKLKVLNNKRKIIIVLIILGMVGMLLFYYFYYYQNTNDEVEVLLNNEEKSSDIDNESIVVDIKGLVSVPGVYSFKKEDDARINDLILKAGGLKKDADTSMLNLSKKLEDEMTVIVYSKSEVEEYVKTQELLKNKLEICELKIKNSACIEETDHDKTININTASKEELMTLNGIGESKANAIIEYRKSNMFQEITDIMNVEGIGESLFENIKDNIKV